MIERMTCTVTGSVIDEQATTRREFYVSCGACAWNHRARVSMFADAEQTLAEHYDQAHDERPGFVWSQRMTSVEFSAASRAIGLALASLGLDAVELRAAAPGDGVDVVTVRRRVVTIPPMRGRTVTECITDMVDGAVSASLGQNGRPAEVVIRNAIDRELERAYLVPKAVAS